MVPFSFTVGVAVKVTVVVSLTSLTMVLTGVVFGAMASRLPPVAVLMLSVTVVGPWYTSLPTATSSTPELAPAAMVIVLPLSRVTVTGPFCAVTGLPLASVSVAV
ncbi:hypothetical protein D3C80_1521430 [compost metagenome]